jgi:hypothetical protein
MLRVIRFTLNNEVFYTFHCSQDFGEDFEQWKIKCQETHTVVSGYQEKTPLRCVQVRDGHYVGVEPGCLEAIFKVQSYLLKHV